jgi:CheY-like chemotaxis protein
MVVIDCRLRTGFQSESMPLCRAESWMTMANARRSVVPVTFNSIGIFGSTVEVPPARALLAPAGVSRHCSPASRAHSLTPTQAFPLRISRRVLRLVSASFRNKRRAFPLLKGVLGKIMPILIVEDEPIVAMHLAIELEAAGHTVIGPAATSLEALQLARQHLPWLALVDITLNGRADGIELARVLQQLGIPSLFLSAQHAEARANKDAALGFIAKPYAAAHVCDSLDIVAAMLAGRTLPAHTGALEVFGTRLHPDPIHSKSDLRRVDSSLS